MLSRRRHGGEGFATEVGVCFCSRAFLFRVAVSRCRFLTFSRLFLVTAAAKIIRLLPRVAAAAAPRFFVTAAVAAVAC